MCKNLLKGFSVLFVSLMLFLGIFTIHSLPVQASPSISNYLLLNSNRSFPLLAQAVAAPVGETAEKEAKAAVKAEAKKLKEQKKAAKKADKEKAKAEKKAAKAEAKKAKEQKEAEEEAAEKEAKAMAKAEAKEAAKKVGETAS